MDDKIDIVHEDPIALLVALGMIAPNIILG
jgi:hypothetical protein